MARFEIQQSGKLQLTSYSGLARVGQCCQIAQVDAVIDPRIPVSQGLRTSDLVKSMIGLLSLGKRLRGDRAVPTGPFFQASPGAVEDFGHRVDASAVGRQGQPDTGHGQ